jgi:hypothetical protein
MTEEELGKPRGHLGKENNKQQADQSVNMPMMKTINIMVKSAVRLLASSLEMAGPSLGLRLHRRVT